MMSTAETARLASNLRGLGAFLDGGFTGTLRVKLTRQNPDGGDIEFEIAYPDWKNISSTR